MGRAAGSTTTRRPLAAPVGLLAMAAMLLLLLLQLLAPVLGAGSTAVRRPLDVSVVWSGMIGVTIVDRSTDRCLRMMPGSPPPVRLIGPSSSYVYPPPTAAQTADARLAEMAKLHRRKQSHGVVPVDDGTFDVRDFAHAD